MKDKFFPFQFAESCMYHYLENSARVEALRAELKTLDMTTSAIGQSYEEHTAPDGYIDNIPARILKIDAIESLIASLERWTKPIARLIVDLESPYRSPERQDMLMILQVRYLNGNTWERTMEHLKMGRGTFADRRRRLVEMAILYLGLKDSSKVPGLKSPY